MLKNIIGMLCFLISLKTSNTVHARFFNPEQYTFDAPYFDYNDEFNLYQ